MLKKFNQLFWTLAASLLVAVAFFAGRSSQLTEAVPITTGRVEAAEGVLGLEFTAPERDSMLKSLAEYRGYYEQIRAQAPANAVAPAMVFNPLPEGFRPTLASVTWRIPVPERVSLPADSTELAYLTVRELGELLRTRQITSEALTRFYLGRLKRLGPKLECVITLTEDTALAQARRADDEIRRGRYKGPLHGIPYGAKDLLAARGYPTTWGATPYRNQYLMEDATVVKKLAAAGAVLCAKLTLGELANGDEWFGGKTRNPWNPEQGSSGSSAGSAAAVSAGLLPFAIGSETWGSIVSPSTVCGVTGLRPTFGRVSRAGAMALSWSMDKIGPICRDVDDCAIVLRAIQGPDPKDNSTLAAGLNYDALLPLKGLRIGYVKADFDRKVGFAAQDSATLEQLRRLGATLLPIELPKMAYEPLSIILMAEAAAAFDTLTLRNGDDRLKQQHKDAWPSLFRSARLIPAVEYIQAQRLRTQLIADMARVMEQVDVYLAPSWADNLLLTNLTGHPAVVVPNGFRRSGTPSSITFTGRLFDEGTLMAVARAYQQSTDWHRRRPPLTK